ncbi:hypothetical protein CVT25_006952 [Psilocybe cyanescens]|uniref:Major facilitator superfamily (MFS) profile domain-containing protein n=1 Tax=Psilocybe cyanescens TaxID=93625 RepID=A0A409VSI0_PSICY|nr:hypothetical protein CVT25_006952 [Psilocybe cyanescens]
MQMSAEVELTNFSLAEGFHGRENAERNGETSSIQEVERDHPSETVINTLVDLSLPPVDTGRQAWLFCICSCMCEMHIWGWNNSYGVFQDYYTSHPPFNNASPAVISAIGTTNLGIQYMEVVLVVAFAQRYPEYVKNLMWISLGICVTALFVSSFATQVWHLILLQGVIFGISAGAVCAPVVIWITDWFVLRRGLAAGLIFGSAGIGGFAFPLVMGYLLKGVGFRWTLRIWALALGVTCGLAILGVNPRITIRRSSMPFRREPWLPRDLSHFKNPLLYCMLAISVLQALSYFPVSILISTYTSSLSSATLSSTVVLAIFNVSSSLSYLLFGRISDSYPYPYIIFASGLGSALAAFFVWGFASSLTLVFAFAAIFGGFSGGISAIWPAAGTDIGGSRDHITTLAMGCFAGFKGIGATIGPIIAASLHDTQSHAKTVYGGFGFRKVEIFQLTVQTMTGSMAVATSLGAVFLNYHSTSKKKVT